MTSKDYKLIAAALQPVAKYPHTDSDTFQDVLDHLHEAFELDNPRYDADLFETAVWGE